jgi:serum/glucocorticoid-regulated kinase 2
VGVLLFEIMTGLPPNYSADRQEMFYSILKDKPDIPSYLSPEAIDLLYELLQKDPS